MAYGDKPKKEKDDMGNKGRKGKGPKPMKGAKKARRESAKQERKNLLTENPVVNRSNDSGFDYTQSKKDIKKRYKKMDKASAPGIANIPHGTVSRFKGSTKTLGNTKAMSAMMGKTIKAGLSAQLGNQIGKLLSGPKEPVLTTGTATILPSMNPPVIKQPLAPKISKVAPASRVWHSTKTFTPSQRDMELKEAHLGEMQTKKGGGAIKPPVVTKEGPKAKKPKSKSQKPKGKPKYTKSETVKAEKKNKRRKRTIKAKF